MLLQLLKNCGCAMPPPPPPPRPHDCILLSLTADRQLLGLPGFAMDDGMLHVSLNAPAAAATTAVAAHPSFDTAAAAASCRCCCGLDMLSASPAGPQALLSLRVHAARHSRVHVALLLLPSLRCWSFFARARGAGNASIAPCEALMLLPQQPQPWLWRSVRPSHYRESPLLLEPRAAEPAVSLIPIPVLSACHRCHCASGGRC